MRASILIPLLFAGIVLGSCQSTRTTPAGPPVLAKFTTDDCTRFPEGTRRDPDAWKCACYTHDIAYWAGGTWKDRLEADRQFRRDIRETGHPLAAGVAFLGVRIGGPPFYKTPWRWGYGWPWPLGYRELSPEELRQVHELMPPHRKSGPRG